MDIQVIGLTSKFDRKNPRNAGVTADELVGLAGGGLTSRWVPKAPVSAHDSWLIGGFKEEA